MISQQDYFNNEYYKDVTDECNNTLMQFGLFTAGVLPSIGYYYRTADDETKSNYYIKLTTDQKNKLFNGEQFSITYDVYGNFPDFDSCSGDHVHTKETISFIPESSKDTALIVFNINNKLRSYKIKCERVKIKGERGFVFEPEYELNIDGDNLYLRVVRLNRTLETDTRTFSMDLYDGIHPIDYNTIRRGVKLTNVEGMKKHIKDCCKAFFGFDETETPSVGEPEIYETETIGGDCWGIERDCIVYDKDGNAHRFEYLSVNKKII